MNESEKKVLGYLNRDGVANLITAICFLTAQLSVVFLGKDNLVQAVVQELAKSNVAACIVDAVEEE